MNNGILAAAFGSLVTYISCLQVVRFGDPIISRKNTEQMAQEIRSTK